VLGLVCHLVNGDLGMLSRHRDNYLGTQPPDGDDESDFIHWLDNLMQEWVSATRGLSPRVAIGLLTWSGPQLVDHFAAQDPMERTAHVQWAGPDMSPIWLNQVRELSEFWIHRQQLLDALDREPDLRCDVLGPIFEGFRWAYPYRLATQMRPPGDSVTIDISGSVAGTWHLVSAEQGWVFAELPGNEVATISMSTDEAWRLLTYNLPSDRQRALKGVRRSGVARSASQHSLDSGMAQVGVLQSLETVSLAMSVVITGSFIMSWISATRFGLGIGAA
jgi:hypothetical protein